VKEFEHKRRIAEEKAAKEMKDLQAVKSRLEALSITIGARAGESGKLFGSVTASQIADKIEAAGLKVIAGASTCAIRSRKWRAQGRREAAQGAGRARRVTVIAEGGPSPEDDETPDEDFDDRRGRRRPRRRR
jgi:hypothetical protein